MNCPEYFWAVVTLYGGRVMATTWKLTNFADVKVTDKYLDEAFHIDVKNLLALDADRFLAGFRETADLIKGDSEDNIKLFMNGSNGTVSLEATKVKMEASNTFEISCNNRVNVEGGNLALTGNSMTKLKSSGPVTVEGTPIKLG